MADENELEEAAVLCILSAASTSLQIVADTNTSLLVARCVNTTVSTDVGILQEITAGRNFREREESTSGTRIEDYVTSVVPKYMDSEFTSHFRMSRSAYEELLKVLGQHLMISGGKGIPVDTKVLMTLWTLANQDSFREIADRFGVHKSSAHYVFISICTTISEHSANFIKWPSEIEQNIIEAKFSNTNGFPGVIGCIDGCHIPIEAPEGEGREAYYNRKKFFSVLLQGTCDHRKRFIDVDIGRAGSCHDAYVFSCSALGQNLSSLLPPERHLLGDSAYPLQVNLMKPYRDNGHLISDEVNFNKKLSSLRCRIEHTFGFLKNKMRRLKHLNMSNLNNMPLVILAACCLHNHILNCDFIEENSDEEDESQVFEEHQEDSGQEYDNSYASRKRNEIMLLLLEK